MIPITSKKGIGKHGKVKSVQEKTVKICGRQIAVRLITYESGLQKSISYFTDRSIDYIRKRNKELVKEVEKLKTKLKEKNKAKK